MMYNFKDIPESSYFYKHTNADIIMYKGLRKVGFYKLGQLYDTTEDIEQFNNKKFLLCDSKEGKSESPMFEL